MPRCLAAMLYSAAWTLALPAVFARFWWRGRHEPAYRQRWIQRLGYWKTLQATADPQAFNSPHGKACPRVWLHAVSLGETRAAQPLVTALRQALPGMQLLLTTGTATGSEAGQALLQPGDLHGWVPLDTAAATRRFFRTLQPDIGILMETETWPNLLRQAQAAGVPVVLANARLSQRSLRKGQRWAALTRPMMESLALVLAQTNEDSLRLQEAGVPRSRLQVMGNLKFDLQPRSDLLEQGRRWREAMRHGPGPRRIVLAASWREGEDAALLKAWSEEAAAARNAGLSQAQRPLLIVVPRHPQRFDEVHAALRSAGLSVSRRSTWGPDGPAGHDVQADAWLGDSMGEMAAYYALADVALLGGSFAPLGGQNLIEAAACSCPIIAGPHTFNFEEAAERAIEEGAARRAPDLPAAVQQALALPAEQLDAHRHAAARFCQRHTGAAQRQAQAINALRDQPPSRGDSA